MYTLVDALSRDLKISNEISAMAVYKDKPTLKRLTNGIGT